MTTLPVMFRLTNNVYASSERFMEALWASSLNVIPKQVDTHGFTIVDESTMRLLMALDGWGVPTPYIVECLDGEQAQHLIVSAAKRLIMACEDLEAARRERAAAAADEATEEREVAEYTARWHAVLDGRADEGPSFAATERRSRQAQSVRDRAENARQWFEVCEEKWWIALEAYCIVADPVAWEQYDLSTGQNVWTSPPCPVGMIIPALSAVMITQYEPTIVFVSKWDDLDEASSYRVQEVLIETGLFEKSRAESWSPAMTYLRLTEKAAQLKMEDMQFGRDNMYGISQIMTAQHHLSLVPDC